LWFTQTKQSQPLPLHQQGVHLHTSRSHPLWTTTYMAGAHRSSSSSAEAYPTDNTFKIKNMLQSLIDLIRGIIAALIAWVAGWFAPTFTFDSGLQAKLGEKIAEGGFSFVYKATSATNKHVLYALKRIHVGDREVLEACKREAAIHQALPSHPNLMPLLGTHLERPHYYMLFPYYPTSLRSVMNPTTVSRPTFSELQVLQLFYQLVNAVMVMHQSGYTHRDIKLDNILLRNHKTEPVLMDFGSVGGLTQTLQQRSNVLQTVEAASQHTTMSIRAPELWDGGLQTGDTDLDYRLVDVWALGCTLFAICYGASPFESEFRKNPTTGASQLRIVECTQLKVLGTVPTLPDDVASWYNNSSDMMDLIQMMLIQDRSQRTPLETIHAVTEGLIVQKHGGRLPRPRVVQQQTAYRDVDNFV